MNNSKEHIVFFDDFCVLCSWAARVIYKNDKKGRIWFSSFDTEAFKKIGDRVPETKTPGGTVILLSYGKVYAQSDAALKIAGLLRFPFPLFKAGYIFPRKFRNFIYDWIARKRYQWFGKRETCYIPQDGMKERFLAS